MLLEKIPLGKTLEIYIDREGYRYRLVSKVEDTNQKRVCVTLIAASGRAFMFHPEDEIRIVYRDEEQMWEWTQIKAGIAKLDDTPVHYFDIADRGRSFNRRNAYRVSYNEEIDIGFYDLPGTRRKSADAPPMEKELELEYSELFERQIIIEPDPVYVRGMIKDVSETGIGIFSDYEFDTEDGIFFDIPTNYGLLNSKAIVIRKDELRATNHRYRYYYGCLFSQTDKRLIRMIYDVQREILKKQRYHQDMMEDKKSQ